MSTSLSSSSYSSSWKTLIISVLAFWLSATVLLDAVIMPGMYASGMMRDPNFVSAGYSIFWMFNRLELLCAAAVLTGVLWIYRVQRLSAPGYWAIALATALLAVPLIYTYSLTPAMSALGIDLNLFTNSAGLPDGMDAMHESYWVLEVIKIAGCASLLTFFYKTIQADSRINA
jgi:hypothetical protein